MSPEGVNATGGGLLEEYARVAVLPPPILPAKIQSLMVILGDTRGLKA